MWRDRIVGIVLGVLLGIGIVAVFVFVFSEETIDSASISQGGPFAKPRHHRGAGQHPAEPGSAVVAVQVLGGAPPESGPAHLDADQDDTVTFTVTSDSPVALLLTGYGITRTVDAGAPTPIRFKATQPGNFALINSATHIAVAQLRVSPR